MSTPPDPATTAVPVVGDPDQDQARVLAHRGGPLLVLGAPGTGKTGTALRLVADRVAAGEVEPDDVLVLTPTRRGAARFRDALALRIGRTVGAPMVRTASSVAFGVLRSRAALLGEPPPVLISGPEQDLVLAELLAGHAVGVGAQVDWPETVPPDATGLRAFRAELRDLLMRAAERGLRPGDLARLGREQARPEWVAAAQVYAEYLDVTRLRSATPDSGARFDPAVIVDEAAEALLAWEDEVHHPRPTWSLVVVDDYQEVTAATVRLLHAVVDGGAELVLLADPDAAVQTFRGAMPGLVDRAVVAGSELGAFGAQQVELGTVWRHGSELRRVTAAVTGQIHGTVRRHRRAAAVADPVACPGTAQVAVLRTAAEEVGYIAWVLRSARLHDGVPWSRMAVLVRSGVQVGALRRGLLEAQVPVAVLGSDVPLRAEPSVRPLLLALRCAAEPDTITAMDVETLLSSPLVGLDPVGLRRVRRGLRAEELAGGGGRASDALLIEAVADPAFAATLPSGARRPLQQLARVLQAGRNAQVVGGATVLDVLWAIWDASGVAEQWRRTALAGGAAGARADRDLDAVLALFTAAEQFVDRLPRSGVQDFVAHLQSQDLPGDSLAAHGDTEQAVGVLTPAGAAGGEWDVVVVAGVQEGVWPDLRLRDRVLGAQHLVELLSGRVVPGADAAERFTQARRAVLDDELRSFAVAASRARRRLVVTAVSDADTRPSPLVDLVQPGPDDGPDPRVVAVPDAVDLRAVVARCRAVLEREADGAQPPGPDHPAARLLARLAAESVPGADPEQWYGVLPLSSTGPGWPDALPVRLGPSSLERAVTCGLRWALEIAGGTTAETSVQSLGTLVHAIAADLPTGTPEELLAELDRRWPELGLPDGWVGSRERRRAESMVRHLAAYLSKAGPPLAVEARFELEVGRVLLRGSVDRLERLDNGVRVVDLKTGTSTVSQADAGRNPQLGAYQLAVDSGALDEVTGGAPVAGACLVYLGTGQKSAVERVQCALHEDAEPTWARELVDQVAAVTAEPAVAASTSTMCRNCPVRRSCPLQPEGRVVGG